MFKTKIIAVSIAALIVGASPVLAQTSLTTGDTSATPQRGAGVGGVGAPADGPSSNQPGSAAQPNSAATPGPGTPGTPGNIPAGATTR